MGMLMPTPIQTIAIFPKIQPDTVAAVFLLRKYGEARFPGISQAEVAFWNATPPGKTAEEFEREGVLLIDLAGSRFDHHRSDFGPKTECASSLVAKHLGIEQQPELRKLLAYAKRDDLEGKGTLSDDPLDRAFGLSGIIMNMNRVHGDDPKSILDFVLSVYEAHVYDEWKRAVELPAEWKALKAAGGTVDCFLEAPGGRIRCVALVSDNIALPGFLRAYVKADLVIQRRTTGHTNLITRQGRRVDLREVVSALRREEALHKNVSLEAYAPHDLHRPGRIDEIEEWFYDTAANTIQNGGVNPQNLPATRLPLDRVLVVVREALDRARAVA